MFISIGKQTFDLNNDILAKKIFMYIESRWYENDLKMQYLSMNYKTE